MANQSKDMFHFDRRSGKDRRSNDVPSAKSLFIYRSRKKVRRKDDKYKMSYLDQYGSGIFIAIVLLLFFSIIDAFLTLFLIDHGASEINPIMAYFLKFGPFTFLSFKYFFTSYSILVLLIFSNFFIRKLKIYTRSLFSYAVGMFLIVIGWELFLMSSIPF